MEPSYVVTLGGEGRFVFFQLTDNSKVLAVGFFWIFRNSDVYVQIHSMEWPASCITRKGGGRLCIASPMRSSPRSL